MAVAVPTNMARAVVVPRAEFNACGVQRVAVIFLIFTHIDRVLTELSIECLTQTSACIDDLGTITLPVVYGVGTSSFVQTWRTNALIHVNIAVSCERVVRGALGNGALGGVLEYERGIVW